LRRICSTEIPVYTSSSTASDNYYKACIRVGYWYYQHGDSKLAWKYFSDSLKTIVHPEFKNFIYWKCIDLKDRNDILDNLQTQMELVEGLDDSVLYILGKSYYKGVSEEPTEKKVKRGVEEYGSRGNEDLKTRANVILKQDYSKALFFLEKSAEKGNHGAQYHLGEMYHHGYGVKVDLGRARKLYDKAATGNEEYAYKVGMVYHCDGELQDFSKAIECYEKTESGYITIHLGILYLYGLGVERDLEKAIEYFKKLSYIPFNSFYLGEVYYNGPGDIQDYNKAFRLFQMVREWSPEHCRWNRTIFARYENNPEKSTTKEKYSFTLELGSVLQGEAYYYLGIMYTKGQGTPQNVREAKKYFLKAVEYGNEKAKQYLE
jgi:TPR repeat protein